MFYGYSSENPSSRLYNYVSPTRFYILIVLVISIVEFDLTQNNFIILLLLMCMYLVSIWGYSPITWYTYSWLKCRWSYKYYIPIFSFNVRSNYNIFIEIIIEYIFQLCDGKCIICDLIFYIQCLEKILIWE